MVGEIDNLTEMTLTLIHKAHERGGFTNSQPSLTIAPRSHMVFMSRNRSAFEGTVGGRPDRATDGTEY